MFELAGRRVWVAGHRGMVGAALVRRLAEEACEILTVGREAVDLRRQAEVEDWMLAARPEVVFIAAATVGGILANDRRPAEFLYDNLAIETNIIEGARKAEVGKLLFLGSTCIYPRLAPQPMPEDSLLTGPLEPTNQWYAVAKIAGVKLCQAYRRQYGCDFVSALPCNLYGPGDRFDAEGGHVIPGLMRRMHEAKRAGRASLAVWGTGRPRREFLHVDDLAAAAVRVLERYAREEPINIGAGEDVTVAELAGHVRDVTGYAGTLTFDPSKPDGTPRKLLDVSRMRALGWRPGIGLREGLADTYRWFLEHAAAA